MEEQERTLIESLERAQEEQRQVYLKPISNLDLNPNFNQNLNRDLIPDLNLVFNPIRLMLRWNAP
jgi:hypothetical protein